MLVKYLKNNKLFLLLFFINLVTIFTQQEKCKAIEHCDLCPDLPKCETCSVGYTLNFYQTKCLLLHDNVNLLSNSSSSQNLTSVNQQTPQLGSPKNSSLVGGQNNQYGGVPQTPSNNLVNNTKPFSSAFDLTAKQNLATSQKGKIVTIVVILVVVVVIILCIRWLISKGKRNRGGYFYDESGNQERAKVVYIQ